MLSYMQGISKPLRVRISMKILKKILGKYMGILIHYSKFPLFKIPTIQNSQILRFFKFFLNYIRNSHYSKFPISSILLARSGE